MVRTTIMEEWQKKLGSYINGLEGLDQTLCVCKSAWKNKCTKLTIFDLIEVLLSTSLLIYEEELYFRTSYAWTRLITHFQLKLDIHLLKQSIQTKVVPNQSSLNFSSPLQIRAQLTAFEWSGKRFSCSQLH